MTKLYNIVCLNFPYRLNVTVCARGCGLYKCMPANTNESRQSEKCEPGNTNAGQQMGWGFTFWVNPQLKWFGENQRREKTLRFDFFFL